MKFIFLFIFISVLSHYAHPQVIKKDGEYPGFEKFILGESRTTFGDKIKFGAKYTENKHELNVYSYLSSINDSVRMAGITFKTILLTFDDSDKLIYISLLKFYTKRDGSRYQKNAKEDYKMITDWLVQQLDEKGKAKLYHKDSHITDIGHEWQGAKTIAIAKKTYSQYSTSIEINFKVTEIY